MYIFLDVIEVADNNANALSLKYLLNTSIIYENNAALSRRSLKLLNDILNKIDDIVNCDGNLTPLLEQFQLKFQYHEL